jgi:hypothetical protein
VAQGLLNTGRLDPAETLARLERASGWLRAEAAAAITRTRAPALSFRLIPVDPDDPTGAAL